MPGRRTTTTTTTQPTPLEETEPTAPAPSASEPAPEPQPQPESATEELPVEDPPEELSPEEATPVSHLFSTAMRKLGSPEFRAGYNAAAAEFAAAQQEDYPLTVHEAIAEVTRRIGAIEKTGRSTEGYRFRGIDQALAALHPILGDVGLVIVPGKVVREQWETRATAKGGTLNVARLLVSYTFVGPDGTRLRAAAWGEGADSGDKATQKAHSQSYKTLVFQTFTIPTETSAEDEPDATNEPARPFAAEEVERARRAWDAALAADTLEALVNVRHRAAALLSVPVPLPNGTVIPLSVLFDQQRGVLEGSVS
jgi:hypothetical protein